jgi:hypothetical protein
VAGDLETLELFQIPNGPNKRSLQLATQIDLAGDAIVEAQPDDVTASISGFQNVKKRVLPYPTG